MFSLEELFRQLEAERDSGELYTVRDWLAENPPPDDAFKQSIAGAARLIREGEPFPHPVRDLLDEFALLSTNEQRQRAIEGEPEPTGDQRYDAYLAALAEHLAAANGLRRPLWTCAADRFLDRFWFPSKVPGFRVLAIAQSPAAFRRRAIFITAGALERV